MERIYKGCSMGGTFRFGDRMWVEPAEIADIRPGEVVVYRSVLPGGAAREVVHRVSRVLGNALETKGDRNPAPDPVLVGGEALVGRVTAFARGGVWSIVPGTGRTPWGGRAWRLLRRLLPWRVRALCRRVCARLREKAPPCRCRPLPSTCRGWFMTAGGPALKPVRDPWAGPRPKTHGRVLPCLAFFLFLAAAGLPAGGAERAAAAGIVKGMVEAPVANLRDRPSLTDSLVVEQLKRGDLVQLLGRSGPWFVVRQADDRLAWGHEVTLAGTAGVPGKGEWMPVEVAVPVGLVREKPTADANAVCRIRPGARLLLIASSGEWRVIELPDRRLGWAHRSLLQETGIAAADAPKVPPVTPPDPSHLSAPPPNRIVLPVPPRTAPPQPVKTVLPEPARTAPPKPAKIRLVPAEPVRAAPLESAGVETPEPPRTAPSESAGVEPAEPSKISPPEPAGTSSPEPVRTAAREPAKTAPPKSARPISPEIAKIAPPEPSRTAVPEPETWNELKEIRFEVVNGSEERVLFALSRSQVPQVSTLMRGNPRVICEFMGARAGNKVWESVPMGGQLVRRIQISQGEGLLPNVQILLDLVPAPGMDYQVQPILFGKENLFTLVVRRIQRP